MRRPDGSYALTLVLWLDAEPQVMYNLTVATAHTFFVGVERALVHNSGVDCGFGFRSLQGKSVQWLKRHKPDGWRTLPTDNGNGWKWVDENGNERLRFYRPTKNNPKEYQYIRQTNGYLRWQDAKGEYLDIDGNVIPKTDEDFGFLTHIPYEGIYP